MKALDAPAYKTFESRCYDRERVVVEDEKGGSFLEPFRANVITLVGQPSTTSTSCCSTTRGLCRDKTPCLVGLVEKQFVSYGMNLICTTLFTPDLTVFILSHYDVYVCMY